MVAFLKYKYLVNDHFAKWHLQIQEISINCFESKKSNSTQAKKHKHDIIPLIYFTLKDRVTFIKPDIFAVIFFFSSDNVNLRKINHSLCKMSVFGAFCYINFDECIQLWYCFPSFCISDKVRIQILPWTA